MTPSATVQERQRSFRFRIARADAGEIDAGEDEANRERLY